MSDLILHTSPIEPLLSAEQLLNGRVLFRFWKDPRYAHDVRTGIVREIRPTKHFGWMVRIDVDPGQGDEMPVKWYSLSAVLGWAWYEEPEEIFTPVPVVVPVVYERPQWTPVRRVLVSIAQLVGATV